MSLLTPEITEWFSNHDGQVRSIEIYKGNLITHFTKYGYFKYVLWKIDNSTSALMPVNFIYGSMNLHPVKERAKNESTNA